jgi:hypothetical protein
MTVQINRTVRTPLRGQPLHDTVLALLQQIARSRDFAIARMQIRSQGSRIIIDARNLMAGAVDMRDGNPSTVSIQMTLTGLAAGPSMVRKVNEALDNASTALTSGQAVPAAPSAGAPGTAPPAGTRQRAPRDPGRALNVFEAISQSISQGVERAFGTPTAPAPPATVPDLPGVPPATPGVLRPPGKPLPPSGYVAPLQPYVAPATGVPWGWIAGGAIAVTGVVLLVSMAKSEREREQ